MWFSSSPGGEECVWLALLIQQLLHCSACVCVCVCVCGAGGVRARACVCVCESMIECMWTREAGGRMAAHVWAAHSCIYPEKPRTHAALRRQHACGGERGECMRCFSRSAVMLVRLQQQWMPGLGGHRLVSPRLLWICLRCSFTHVAWSHVNTEGWCGMRALALIPQGFCVLASLTVRFKLWCGCGATNKNTQLRGAPAHQEPGEAARRSVMHVSYLGLWQRIRCPWATHWHWAEMRWCAWDGWWMDGWATWHSG